MKAMNVLTGTFARSHSDDIECLCLNTGYSEVIAMSKQLTIPCQEARRLVAAGAQLVDVRSPQEHAQGAFPGSVNLPLQTLQDCLHRLIPVSRSLFTVPAGCAVNKRHWYSTRMAGQPCMTWGLTRISYPVSEYGRQSNRRSQA